jgi:hypothetical protein
MKRSLLVVLYLTTTVCCPNPLCGADLALTPRRGVLLLNNGELIEGTITAAGDRYDVQLKDGQIHVRTSQVALLARDVQECYRHRRAEIQFGRVRDYLELAEWCLRNGLLDGAQQEIAAAKAADATHPKIPLVETRLRLAREKSSAIKLPTPREPKPQQNTPLHQPPNQPNPVQPPLEVVLGNLRPGAVETFTNNVQPLLLNYCARSGCHSSPSSAMRLERMPPNRHSGRSTTQRNLSAVLAVINRDNPPGSKLLTVPIRPHGGSDRVIFTDRQQSQYKQLVHWVYQVAGPARRTAQPTPRQRTAPSLERDPNSDPRTVGATTPVAATAAAGTAPRPLPSMPESDSAGASKRLPGAATPNTPASFSDDSRQGQPPSAPQPAAAAPYRPKDPFDPEIFNRRYSNP